MNLYPQGVWFACVMPSFSGVTFALFRFCIYTFIEAAGGPSFNRSSICRRPDSHTSFFFFPFASLKMSLFPSICVSLLFIFVWRVRRTFFLPNGVFLPCDHGLDFLHRLTSEFNGKKNQSYDCLLKREYSGGPVLVGIATTQKHPPYS